MTDATTKEELTAPTGGETTPRKGLTLGAVSWSIFQACRDPYVTLVSVFVFMPYFGAVVVGNPVKGQEAVATAGQFSGWIVMLTAPFLGAAIDKIGRRKGWLGLLVGLMVPLIGSLWFALPGGRGLSVVDVVVIITAVSVMFSYTEVLHNSLLLTAAGRDQVHKASGLGIGMGHLVSLVTLSLVTWGLALPGKVAWGWVPTHPLFGLSREFHQTERIAAPIAAGLLAIGAIPFFLFTRDASPTNVQLTSAVKAGLQELASIFKDVRAHYRNVAVFMVSRMLLVDGMTAIGLFIGLYAHGVMRWDALELLVFGVVMTVPGAIGGLCAPWLDQKATPRGSLIIQSIVLLAGLSSLLTIAPDHLWFWRYTPATQPLWNGPVLKTLPDVVFFLNVFFNTIFSSGIVSTSRTLMTRLAPQEKMGAFFGLYAISGAATTWLGPMMVNVGTHIFGTQQGGIAMALGLVAAGAVGFCFVRNGHGKPVG